MSQYNIIAESSEYTVVSEYEHTVNTSDAYQSFLACGGYWSSTFYVDNFAWIFDFYSDYTHNKNNSVLHYENNIN